jgi:EpsI family protein
MTAMPAGRSARQGLVNAVIAVVLMAAASWAADHWRPRQMLADTLPQINLAEQLPRAFGPWREDDANHAGIVNPQLTEGVARLYNQVLTRVYIHKETGERMMLSVAYGRSQQDGLQLHVPDVCYPSQGFEMSDVHYASVPIAGRQITVKHALATASNRVEPLTYWAMLGDGVKFSELDRKMAQIRYGFQGLIPDGMLVRASMISGDAPRAWVAQAEFLKGLIAQVPPDMQARFVGAH